MPSTTNGLPRPAAGAISDQPRFNLDRRLVRRRFRTALATADQVATLSREIAARMDERLDYIRLDPKRIIDLGCGTGTDLLRLGERFPGIPVTGIDFALPGPAQVRRSDWRRRLSRKFRAVSSALATARSGNGIGPILGALFNRSHQPETARIAADANALPIANGSTSLIWSNLMLNWLDDPAPAFAEVHRVLEPGGLLMFSTLGPDTLQELRQAFGDASAAHVHHFIDMHDLGDALVRAGFSDPVMDMEMITIRYTSARDLFDDLRRSGCNNASATRCRGLFGRRRWDDMLRHLELTREGDGRFPMRFEVIQGHAWKATPTTTPDGRSVVHFHPFRRT